MNNKIRDEYLMPWTSEHTKWFVDTEERLNTADGKEVEVWEFRHENDEEVLSDWAKHFRNHYCLDTAIDSLRGRRSRAEYLTDIKLPCKTSRLGCSTRAGDFGEILIADYLQYILGYWVPRVRWSSKVRRDESLKGCDIIGFQFFYDNGEVDPRDRLIVFESKTKFSRSKENRLQQAINDSAKDHIRIDESLNFIKQKFFETQKYEYADKIDRFQSPVDMQYKEVYGAAAVISDEFFSVDELTSADSRSIPVSAKSKVVSSHPKGDKLVLLIIKGARMMDLVHELYRRATDEA